MLITSRPRPFKQGIIEEDFPFSNNCFEIADRNTEDF